MRRRALTVVDDGLIAVGQVSVPWHSDWTQARRQERARRKRRLLDEAARLEGQAPDPLVLIVYVGYAPVAGHPSALRRAQRLSLRLFPRRLP